jgi:hypothetical protein
LFLCCGHIRPETKKRPCASRTFTKSTGAAEFRIYLKKYSVVREGHESSIKPPSGEKKKPVKARNLNRQLHHHIAGASISSAVTS